jgi:AraC family transcriptional regulator
LTILRSTKSREIGVPELIWRDNAVNLRLLVWQFTKSVLVANLLAKPVAWWVMRGWLNSFDAGLELGIKPFVAAEAGRERTSGGGRVADCMDTRPLHAIARADAMERSSQLDLGAVLKGAAHIGKRCRSLDLDQVKLAVIAASGAPDEVRAHGHEEAHLLLVATPGYTSCADDAPGLTPGSAAIFNPRGTYHQDRFVRPGLFLSISLDSRLVDTAADEWRLPQAPRMTERMGVIRRASALVGMCIRGDAQEVCATETISLELLGEFAGPQAVRAAAAWLPRARQLLHDQIDLPAWSVQRVAAALDVTPTHFARAFRAQFGCTPGDYIHAVRCRRAATLLARTRAPIAEIALSLGYSDQSHFTRWFARTWRVTPGAFRSAVA